MLFLISYNILYKKCNVLHLLTDEITETDTGASLINIYNIGVPYVISIEVWPCGSIICIINGLNHKFYSLKIVG